MKSPRVATRRRRVARVPMARIGEGLTRFPFVLDLAQNEHERLLIAQLATYGVAVERGTKRARFEQDDGDEARDALLDSYEQERIAFARRLVRTTDRAVVAVSRTGTVTAFIRTRVVPLLLPLALRSAVARGLMFRTISQLAINYRRGAPSEGRAGGVRGGDRLPWLPASMLGTTDADNFTPLESFAWQVHVYGEASASLRQACAERGLRLAGVRVASRHGVGRAATRRALPGQARRLRRARRSRRESRNATAVVRGARTAAARRRFPQRAAGSATNASHQPSGLKASRETFRTP